MPPRVQDEKPNEHIPPTDVLGGESLLPARRQDCHPPDGLLSWNIFWLRGGGAGKFGITDTSLHFRAALCRALTTRPVVLS